MGDCTLLLTQQRALSSALDSGSRIFMDTRRYVRKAGRLFELVGEVACACVCRERVQLIDEKVLRVRMLAESGSQNRL